jgi:hypothetical protein
MPASMLRSAESRKPGRRIRANKSGGTKRRANRAKARARPSKSENAR